MAKAVKKLKGAYAAEQAYEDKQAQLAQAYKDLGGTNPAYLPTQPNYALANPNPRMTATIPQLEKAVMEAYNSKPQTERNVGNKGRRSTGNSQGKRTAAQNIAQYAADDKNNRNQRDRARQQNIDVYNDITNRQSRSNRVVTLPGLEAAGYERRNVTNDILKGNDQARGEANVRAFAENHPVLATLGAGLAKPNDAAQGLLNQVGSYITGKLIKETYNPADVMREAVSEGIDSKVGNIAYSGLNSLIDMGTATALAALTGGGSLVGTGALGLEKANDVMNNAVNRGLSPNQILGEGITSGLATAATEAIPMGRFLNGGKMVGSAISEGVQEGLEDLADTAFDQIITAMGGNHDKSELTQTFNAYRQAGADDKTALIQTVKDYAGQVGVDVLLGGITGGLMQGGSNVISGRNAFSGNLNESRQNRILNDIRSTSEGVAPKDFSQFAQDLGRVRENIPELSNGLDKILNDYTKGVLSDIQSAGDVVLDNPEAYNDFVQNAQQIKSQIPALAQDINNELARVSGQLSVLNSIDSEVNSNVDNVNSNVDVQPIYMSDRARVNQFKNEVENYLEKVGLPIDLVSEGNTLEQLVNLYNNGGMENVQRVIDANVQRMTPEVQNAQPEVTAEPRASRREVNNAIRTAEGVRDNLKMFNTKNARVLTKRVDKAINAVRNSSGQAQIQAINDLNNIISGVNNVMNGESIGVDERTFNRDMWQRMKNVTDGRRFIATPEMLRNNNLTLKDLNDNYLNTGTNRIRAYAPQNVENTGAVSLDSIWNEMVDLSNGELPNVSEGDQLQALIDYVNAYKTRKGDTVNSQSWEDLQTDFRSEAERQLDDIADNLFDKIEDGTLTDKEYNEAYDRINALQRKNPELADKAYQLITEAMNAKREMSLDRDVRNIKTVEEAQGLLDSAVNDLASSIPMNLKMFSGYTDSDVNTNEDLGRVNTGRFKTSKVFTNTAENSGILSDKQREMHEDDGSMLYMENSERESVDEASKRLDEYGLTNELERLLDKESYTNVDTDEMMMIWKRFNDRALALDEKGLDSTSAWNNAYKCLKKIKSEGSREGSALQALAKWSRSNTPEGLLAQATSIITAAENGYSGYSKTDQGWFKQIAKETKGKTKEMETSFIKDFITEARKLEGLDIDSQQAKHIMANLGKMVNSQIPVTLREKVTTILMDNMLGNFRTLITRNAGGNVAFNMIEQKLRKPLSAKIDEKLSQRRGTERTISKNTNEGRSAYREGFKEAVKQELYDFANNIQSARSGENTLATAVTNNRQVFKDSNIFGKIGNFYNKLVKAGLSAGDRPFYEGVYHQYMTEFQKMYDDGKLGDMKEAEFKKLAEANAQLKALEAVYQDDSSMAQAFMKMKEGVNNLSQGIIGADLLSQFTMPFVKTPANIIQRAIEYSPIGVVKNAIQTVREVNHAMTNNGMMDFNQERFATETARNLIGSVLFTAAVLLAKSGAMTGGYSDDKDMAQAQKEAGMQEYALHNPLGFNGDVSVDWIPVLGNDMVAAASAYDAFRNNPELNAAQRIGKGLTAGLKSQFESSMLQGLQRLVGGSGSFGGDGDILTNAVDTIKSGATQFIPSIIRQGAAVSDPYRRQLSGANPDDYYVNSVLNSIPGLRQSLEPRVTRTGENMEQNAGRNLGWKIFDNFINPATVTVGTPDNVRDEAMRIFESTNSNRAFEPAVTISELKVDDHVPTAEEYTEYQRNTYGAMNDVAEEVIGSDYYDNLSDDDKVSMLADIYSAIKTVEKKRVLDLDTDGLTGAEKAYFEDGTDGLIEYMTARSALSQMGLQNNESNREHVIEAYNQGGAEAVNQMIEESQELEEAGLNTNMQFKYEHATHYIPSLSPTQFADTWNAINTDNNTSIKQQEIIDYLNRNPNAYTNNAMQYWQAYGSSDWKKIPTLNPDTGLWEAK